MYKLRKQAELFLEYKKNVNADSKKQQLTSCLIRNTFDSDSL